MAEGAGRRAIELEGYASNHPAAGEVTADNKNNNLQSAICWGVRNQELTDNQIQRDQRTQPDKHNHCSDGLSDCVELSV